MRTRSETPQQEYTKSEIRIKADIIEDPISDHLDVGSQWRTWFGSS